LLHYIQNLKTHPQIQKNSLHLTYQTWQLIAARTCKVHIPIQNQTIHIKQQRGIDLLSGRNTTKQWHITLTVFDPTTTPALSTDLAMTTAKDNPPSRGKSITKTITNAAFEEMDVDAPQPSFHKRINQPSASKAQPKRAKNNLVTSLFKDQPKLEFWLGFPAMEQLAQDNGVAPASPAPVADLIKLGYTAEEAEETKLARISFPRVPQKLWPSKDQTASKVSTTTLPSCRSMQTLTTKQGSH
jgi:hypothetical protein